jgi:hypothetical protein
MDTKYFAEEVVGVLEDVCYPEVRNPHQRKMTLRFDNAPIRHIKGHGTIEAVRAQEDGASGPSSGCGPV